MTPGADPAPPSPVGGGPGPDPLDHPDPREAAAAAAAERLVRSYVREHGIDVPPAGQEVRLGLPASGLHLAVPVRYRSATGWHRFGPARLLPPAAAEPGATAVGEVAAPGASGALPAPAGTGPGTAPGTGVGEAGALEGGSPCPGGPGGVCRPGQGRARGSVPPASAAVANGPTQGGFSDGAPGAGADGAPGAGSGVAPVAGAGAAPLAGAAGLGAAGAGCPAGVALVAAALVRETTVARALPPHRGDDAVARVLDSAARTAAHLTRRRGEERGAEGPTPFLDAEQALLLGHPFHPAPKSREEATEAELDAWSPEMRGSFPLHWFAAHPDVVAGESADGRTVAGVLRPLARGLDLPPGMLPVPAHPWQAREVLRRPGTAALVDAGLLRPLGPYGPAWWPTSSVRTVHRPDAAVMLKLSLGMRITNSRRNNLRGELRLGVRAARLLAAGPAAWLRAEHPEFGILRDFAWVSAGPPEPGGPGGRDAVPGGESGLETAIRDNPFRGGPDDALCLAGLLAERTGPGDGRPPRHRALLSAAVAQAARVHGVGRAEAAARWLDRCLDVLAVPLIRLYARYGIALEPHHQNTLLALSGDGLPRAGWYRDSQGYYVAASRAGEAERLLPGVTTGVELVFDDALVDERIAYYLGVNNLLGLVGAFGALGLAAEEPLLRRVRDRLAALRGTEPGARGLLDTLLDAPALRCKGNYLTCVDGRDELVGDVHTQSVYLDLPNPLREATP
ncbi:IucA/IucC family siderophore biosynthesis protein [Streptomyces sp. JJ36]|uniref:IucA/IucC family protein n=1 Tax=Streptomyces sp. JJ36 TaxID=2736645 RepID=UPI001F46740A|nr:IucA/IucC family protein [Streptomyces sp. JJ36]MCF6524304.1 iron transporter [Streptomyces sp. JJ36]